MLPNLGTIYCTFKAIYPGGSSIAPSWLPTMGSSTAPSRLPTLGIIYCTFKATYPGDHLLHLQGYLPWGSSITPSRLPTLGIIYYTFKATYPGDHPSLCISSCTVTDGWTSAHPLASISHGMLSDFSNSVPG